MVERVVQPSERRGCWFGKEEGKEKKVVRGGRGGCFENEEGVEEGGEGGEGGGEGSGRRKRRRRRRGKETILAGFPVFVGRMKRADSGDERAKEKMSSCLDFFVWEGLVLIIFFFFFLFSFFFLFIFSLNSVNRR